MNEPETKKDESASSVVDLPVRRTKPKKRKAAPLSTTKNPSSRTWNRITKIIEPRIL